MLARNLGDTVMKFFIIKGLLEFLHCEDETEIVVQTSEHEIRGKVSQKCHTLEPPSSQRKGKETKKMCNIDFQMRDCTI